MKKLCAKQNRRAKQWEFSQSVRKLFAMCCEFRNAKNHSEFRNAKFRNAKTTLQISQCEKPHCEFRNAKNHCEFRNAKFRNAKTTMRNFAMPKSISQCQFQFRNAKISQCEISQCQSPFRIAKFTAFAKFTLRNFQALSSSVINAEPPSIFGLLLFCPIT